MKTYEAIVIGGGQSGLAMGYYLRRKKVDFTILDASPEAGGAWQEMWDSLHLFSPAEHNALPGWWMPKSRNEYPNRDEVVDYLKKYEERYQLPIDRPVEVEKVFKENDLFCLETNQGKYFSKAVVSATGTWTKPYIPAVPGYEKFQGEQLHTVDYKNPEPFKGKKVVIVGGGNSGAQILAEVSKVADTLWAVNGEPEFLPDEVDGHYLFQLATQKYKAGNKDDNSPNYSLGSIVMVPSVKEAHERRVLKPVSMFSGFYEKGVYWEDGTREEADAVIWCTGFKAALDHLEPLGIFDENNRIPTETTKVKDIDGLWLVGYGQWTGFASATIIGVGRTARKTVLEVQDFLEKQSINS